MKRVFPVILVLMLSGGDAGAQIPDLSPRIAAFRFAFENGFAIPRDSVVVAIEPRFGLHAVTVGHQASVRDVPGADELPMLEREARDIAALIGSNVPTVASKHYLQCVNNSCATKTRYTVVVVERPLEPPNQSQAGAGVTVVVYSPGATRSERAEQRAMITVTRTIGGFSARFAQPGFTPPIVPSRVAPLTRVRRDLRSGAQYASQVDQFSFELLASKHLILIDSATRALAGFVFDPLMYELDWNADINRDRVMLAIKGGAHADTNPKFLADYLGLSGVVDERKSCAVFRPSECRIGEHLGAVAFSRAWLRGNEAQIVLFSMSRKASKPGDKPEFVLTGWRFHFTNSAQAWTVSRVDVKRS
jgi:hypothetical protein